MKSIYLLCIMLGVLFCRCAEDKGNYDYTPVDELTITGIDGTYTKIVGDSLKIPVTFEHTVQGENENYEYLWEMDGKKIADTRDLGILTPSDMSFGNKTCRYTVIDKDNGMKYYKNFAVNIVSPFNWGYYLLTEREDHSSVISYFSVMDGNDKFIQTTSISGVELGDMPRSLAGKFGHISALKDYFWTITSVTSGGENPVIITENATFIPNNIVNTSCFVDQESGYVFAPEFAPLNRQGNQFFISQGKFISYNKGLLYRPAKHGKDYYWSDPVWSQAGYPHMFVFDKLSQKYYTIQSQPNVPEEGIVGDSYAYDKVVVITDCPSFEGHTIIGTMAEYAAPWDDATIVTASSNGITLIKISYAYSTGESKCGSPVVLPLAGVDSDSKALLVGKDWYFAVGNKIYTSPVLLPTLADFVTIPEDCGKIVSMNSSAMQSLLVVATYNEKSSEELKGSVIFIDMQTKKQTVYKNVIHKCVSILSCNADPYGWEGYGDGK